MHLQSFPHLPASGWFLPVSLPNFDSPLPPSYEDPCCYMETTPIIQDSLRVAKPLT